MPPFFCTRKMGFGDYPAAYNREIHGPYYPWRYYGKPDTPFGEVKLGDLPKWLSRRSLNPIDWGTAVGRAYWRWNNKWLQPKRISFAGFHQFFFFSCLFMYAVNFDKHWAERQYKYH